MQGAQLEQEVAKQGTVDVGWRLAGGFWVGSILYIVFDVLLMMLISQNLSRPSNRRENQCYTRLMSIVIFLGAAQMITVFANTVFT